MTTTPQVPAAGPPTTRRLLLHGSICIDRGNGYQFYKALEAATVDDLRFAWDRLNQRYGGIYSYYRQRRQAIMQRLLELEA